MEILTRELNGVRCDDEKRVIEVTFKHWNTEVDCGCFNYKERIELAEHLKGVVDDLLYELDQEILTKE